MTSYLPRRLDLILEDVRQRWRRQILEKRTGEQDNLTDLRPLDHRR
jgi:hypothetical protein